MKNNKIELKDILEKSEFFTLPGVYDCLGAKIAEKVGFEAIYLSGGALSLAALGKPDSGYLNFTDLKISIERIISTVDIPIITDTDNCFGNAMHAATTAMTLERMGVSGMQIDDNVLPQLKPNGSKDLISWDYLAPKLEAVRKSTSDNFVIILRTIIGKTEGMQKAVERANNAHDLGIDYVFVDGLNSVEDMEFVSKESRAKLMLNLNENSFPATVDMKKVKSMNYRIGLYPISTLQVAAKSMFEALNLIKEKGTAFEMKNKMTTYSEILELLNYYEDIEKYSNLYK